LHSPLDFHGVLDWNLGDLLHFHDSLHWYFHDSLHLDGVVDRYVNNPFHLHLHYSINVYDMNV